MENFKYIEYHVTRDFSRKMNATFEFIRQNFKPLFKCILFIAGPPVLVASILLGSFFGDIIGLSTAGMTNPEGPAEYFRSVNFWLQILLMFVFIVISGVMTLATINNYIVIYGEKHTNKIDVQEVWTRVRQTFWMHLLTMILFALMGIVVYIIALIPFMLLMAISPVMLFFGVLILFGAFAYIFVGASFTFFIRLIEKKGFFEAVARSFKLIQGKWWSTFGLLIVLSVVAGILSYIPLIPWYIMIFVSALHNTSASPFASPSGTTQVITVVFFSLYYLVNLILQTLPNLGLAFQYFNLVEMKEARGLMQDIESFGQTPQATPPQDEHY
jgi:hypothetical protein